MRDIKVSTGVFAAIWANRMDDEETEDEILQRLLLTHTPIADLTEKEENSKKMIDGVYDHRNGVRFPEGMRIFRNYKGREYSAIAQSGQWVREDTRKKYSTLNQLNSSIAAGPENVWNGTWRFVDGGFTRSINTLRKRVRSV